MGLLLSLAVLMVLQRETHRHLQGLFYLISRRRKTALILYAVLFLPGVLIHEGSHWLAAKLLRVPTRGFSLIPSKSREGMIRFGYVETAVSDPVRASLIGVAPLLAGTAVLIIITFEYLGLRDFTDVLFSGDLGAAVLQITALMSTPDLLLWLYLAFAVGNTMFPSKSDRASWISAAIIVAALLLVAVASGVLDGLSQWLIQAARFVTDNLTGIFVITAGLDIVILLPLLLLEKLTSRLLGREIVYSG